jgi:hypothetical protein
VARWQALLGTAAGRRLAARELRSAGMTRARLTAIVARLASFAAKKMIVLYVEDAGDEKIESLVAPLLAWGVPIKVLHRGSASDRLRDRLAAQNVQVVDVRTSGLLVHGRDHTVDTDALASDFRWDPRNLVFAKPDGVRVVHSGVSPTVMNIDDLAPLVRLITVERLLDALRLARAAA